MVCVGSHSHSHRMMEYSKESTRPFAKIAVICVECCRPIQQKMLFTVASILLNGYHICLTVKNDDLPECSDTVEPAYRMHGAKFLWSTIFADWPSTSFCGNNFCGSEPGDLY